MKIAIIGRTEMLYETAELLLKQDHSIKIIITAKEAPEYKKTARDFEKLANKIGARYLYTSRISNKDSINFIKNVVEIDIGVSMNYINVISQEVIELFPYGILNAHGGDLPRYRGNACQAWAILNGEKFIGLCIHKMIGGELDSGDIISRDYLNIDINTKIQDVYNWMSEKIPQLFLKAISELEKDKKYILERQSENPEDALRCYPILPEDGRIDWSRSNIEILRLINASSEPYGGAFCEYKEKKLIIWDAEVYEDRERYCAVPGQIAGIEKEKGCVIIITGKGKLKLLDIEYNGHRTRPANVIKSIRSRLK